MKWVEVIAHRSECYGMLTNSYLDGAEILFEAGIRSFEFDIFDFAELGITIGHPDNVGRRRTDSLESILAWATSKSVNLYLDIKYPARWSTPIATLLNRLSILNKDSVVLFSYDAYFFERQAIESGYTVGLAIDETYETASTWSGLFLVPVRQILRLPVSDRSMNRIIATRVNTRAMLGIAKKLSCTKIMTDKALELIRFCEE